jgi:hypothetical protein
MTRSPLDPDPNAEYPEPHYDEDDTCKCPDHRAMRAARREMLEGPMIDGILRRFLGER